jgi:hypothetical protein
MILESFNPNNCLRLSEITREQYRKRVKEKIPNVPGAYIIIYSKNGVPQHLNRLNGVDEEGIFCIGKTKNLAGRIIQFVSDILTEGLKVNVHSEGWNFRRYFRDNPKGKIKPRFEDLEIYWKILESESAALKFETRLIQSYVMNFQDKPPLNISIKRER